ncbi:monooxygenase [Alkalihalobacterium chitinilyticum]|uniref:Monooxygenase n=1 Tax=Alkalihalobacterium chitinilyticum TaxID=2980103 RepID=A0ABT5VI12_9BACI|nr:monooxygenase [Alkalihalobacterium chitinilyticum]MDE5415091.1 monooxygenase [Alkalihalobacterium chitinilyticum]
MAYILQVDFPMDGPFGDEMVDAFRELAKSINEEEGLLWKIWTENPESKEAGGIYLFASKQTAQNYLKMHMSRLNDYGIEPVHAKLFEVNEALSKINNGPIK